MAYPVNSTHASPLADASFGGPDIPPEAGIISALYNGVNGLSLTVFVLLTLVAYDQCGEPQSQIPD